MDHVFYGRSTILNHPDGEVKVGAKRATDQVYNLDANGKTIMKCRGDEELKSLLSTPPGAEVPFYEGPPAKQSRLQPAVGVSTSTDYVQPRSLQEQMAAVASNLSQLHADGPIAAEPPSERDNPTPWVDAFLITISDVGCRNQFISSALGAVMQPHAVPGAFYLGNTTSGMPNFSMMKIELERRLAEIGTRRGMHPSNISSADRPALTSAQPAQDAAFIMLMSFIGKHGYSPANKEVATHKIAAHTKQEDRELAPALRYIATECAKPVHAHKIAAIQAAVDAQDVNRLNAELKGSGDALFSRAVRMPHEALEPAPGAVSAWNTLASAGRLAAKTIETQFEAAFMPLNSTENVKPVEDAQKRQFCSDLFKGRLSSLSTKQVTGAGSKSSLVSGGCGDNQYEIPKKVGTLFFRCAAAAFPEDTEEISKMDGMFSLHASRALKDGLSVDDFWQYYALPVFKEWERRWFSFLIGDTIAPPALDATQMAGEYAAHMHEFRRRLLRAQGKGPGNPTNNFSFQNPLNQGGGKGGGKGGYGGSGGYSGGGGDSYPAWEYSNQHGSKGKGKGKGSKGGPPWHNGKGNGKGKGGGKGADQSHQFPPVWDNWGPAGW